MFLFHDGRARAEKALKQNFKANDMKKLLGCQMSSFKEAREMLLLLYDNTYRILEFNYENYERFDLRTKALDTVTNRGTHCVHSICRERDNWTC